MASNGLRRVRQSGYDAMSSNESPLEDSTTETTGTPESSALQQEAWPRFPVVGIGASAGGLEAFGLLLSHLPNDTGMAFVLVQHLDPRHESRLRDLLTKSSSMPIVDGAQDMVVEPNHVYVIPPNKTMTMSRDALQLTPRNELPGPHLTIDSFLKSLAENYQSAAVGVILSGMGSDGTLGLEAIKAVGGITFAQDEPSAKHFGMPQSAIRSGCVDLVLTPDAIARELVRVGGHPYVSSPPEVESSVTFGDGDGGLKEILLLLRSSFGVDFSTYRDTTIKRRIARRMVLHTKDNLTDYAQYLVGNHSELEALFQDILINVTSFFRDPEAFEALKRVVFPAIWESKESQQPIRIWAPGCSTGQESYSLAMALTEFLDDKPVRRSVQFFGTDLSDSVSLHKAREGIYPENIEAEVSQDRLRRFFTKEDSKYRVKKCLRDMCVFARQNVASDPPFSQLDLISCRNLLIYFAPQLQKRIIPTFHYALNPGGFLLLGASETIGPFTDLFGLVEQEHKIFRKKVTSSRLYPHFTRSDDQRSGVGGRRLQPLSHFSQDWQREADRTILNRYGPAGVLVNDNLDVLQFRGQTSPYLAHAAGEPTQSLPKLLREGLFVEICSAVNECREHNRVVQRKGVKVRGDDEVRSVDVRVEPLRLTGSTEKCFLILFETPDENTDHERSESLAGRLRTGIFRTFVRRVQRSISPTTTVATPVMPAPSRESQLQKELDATREYLQSVIEQQDAANEELKSASEEILSTNEELQSTNEELETAKEELQSVNEELTTVNDQLQMRNFELGRINDDSANFLASAAVAMVVLGVDLRIRRFTPTAGKLLSLLPGDIGRPIGNLRAVLDLADLETMAAEVVDNVHTLEKEVKAQDGHWYLIRIQPYRTADNRIDGAVLVLLDVNEMKVIQAELRGAHDFAMGIVENVREPLLVLDQESRIVSASHAFYEEFGVTPEETERRILYDLNEGRWDLPKLRQLLKEVLTEDTAFNDFEFSRDFPEIGRRNMLLNARRLQHGGKPPMILLAIEDVTDRLQIEVERREHEQRYRTLVEQVKDYAVFRTDIEGHATTWNEGVRTVLGFEEGEFLGQDLRRIFTPEDVERGIPEWELTEAARTGTALNDRWMMRKDGKRFFAKGVTTRLLGSQGELVGYTKVMRDETELKDAMEDREELLESERAARTELERVGRIKDEFVATLSHELRTPLNAIMGFAQILGMKHLDAAEQQEAAATIVRNARLQAQLIDDLLDMNRMVSGKLRLNFQNVNLQEVIGSALESVSPAAEAKGIVVKKSFDPAASPVRGDPARLQQVIWNLLANAVKFTPKGGQVHVDLSQASSHVRVRVDDTGIGIAAEFLPHVFERFRQADASSSRRSGGLGLGLSIAKQLVELHGGGIEVHSPGEGMGASFVVTLPITAVREPRGTETDFSQSLNSGADGDLTGVTVLVVDDDLDACLLVKRLLNERNAETVTAVSAEEALANLDARKFDILISDLGMPSEDGYQLLEKVRKCPPEKNGNVPAIALSALARNQDRSRAAKAGFQVHLSKPVEANELMAHVAKLAGRSWA